MAIDVTVTEQCSRCKRKNSIVVSSDKLEEFEAAQKRAAEYQEKVKQFVKDNEGTLPDLVVIFKGEVQMFDTVCDAFCKTSVANALKLVFREAKPRTGRKGKKKNDAEAPADTAAAGANGGNGNKKKKDA